MGSQQIMRNPPPSSAYSASASARWYEFSMFVRNTRSNGRLLRRVEDEQVYVDPRTDA
jgi:hypothetical protein